MSSLTMIGFLALCAGRCTMALKPGSPVKVFHCLYTTAVQCSSGDLLPAKLHAYSPPNDTILPDNTVAFVIAKVFAPPNADIILNAIHVVPLPGNPNNDDYESHIPDVPHPFFLGLGSAQGLQETLADGKLRGFTVLLSDYVRESVKQFNIQFVSFFCHRLL
ncbi:hypothetical protein JAAARDRAFT_143925 [Jaapia argillacea MUCL 33604]|uniref:Uncharacterized protein n=1 Tax=Jaapia argillacea MUCL 33604 TaxID=933084 RepID=A0A067P2U5_9AGAM|nr:hypothetical protein JAAARDRAFT_143925 [Jaapia argillacea MUCL 33604]